jgi:peptidoglycan/LPS O-acetylase OafA/YrhL
MLKQERYANVDGLRLICALAVLLFHYGYRGSLDGLYERLLPWAAVADPMKYGHIGVHIFFCISGFVIAYSAAGRSAFEFATARFARIYPTFILCMTMVFALRWVWGAPELPTSLAQYFAGLAILPKLFGQNFLSGVYWSIVVELWFYAWVFLLLVTGLMQRFSLPVISVWLVLAGVNELMIGNEAVRMVLITEFAPYFIFGMLLHQVQVMGRISWPVGATLGAAVAVGVAVLLRETDVIRATFHIAMSDVTSVSVLMAGMLALVWAVEVRRLLVSAAVLAWAGGISYPFYLLHEGLGQVMFVRLRSTLYGPVLFLDAALGVVLLATLVWWGFDRRAVAWTRAVLSRISLPQFPAFQWKASLR